MDTKDEILKFLAKPINEEVQENISEEERMRWSLPKIKLSEIELEFIKGIATGRSRKELDVAIKLSTNERFTFNSMKNNLLIKFEAFTLPHIVFKAIIMGFLTADNLNV